MDKVCREGTRVLVLARKLLAEEVVEFVMESGVLDHEVLSEDDADEDAGGTVSRNGLFDRNARLGLLDNGVSRSGRALEGLGWGGTIGGGLTTGGSLGTVCCFFLEEDVSFIKEY